MFQVRIHGRGGQGVVTAAEMLSVAAFLHGRHAQAFPSFGSEQMGAPVVAYCRIDSDPIRTHDPVSDVDCLVIQDPTLLHEVDLFSGLHSDSYVLINSERTFGDLGVKDIGEGMRLDRLLTVPATELARQCIGRPVPNTALLGGLVAMTDVVPLTGCWLPSAAASLVNWLMPTPPRPARQPPLSAPNERRLTMLDQIEGSQAVAHAVARLPSSGSRLGPAVRITYDYLVAPGMGLGDSLRSETPVVGQHRPRDGR